MGADSSEDEIEIFTRKIKTLRGIAGDLNNVIELQNNRIKGINPEIGGILGRLQNMVARVGGTDNKRFKSWKYYFLATLLIVGLIFILFVVF